MATYSRMVIFRAWALLATFCIPSFLGGQQTGVGEPPFALVGETFFAVQVQDDAAAAAWYSRAFGLAEIQHIAAEDGRYSIRTLGRGGLTVELIRLESTVSGPDPRFGLFKAGFYVDDIDVAYRWLESLGTEMDERVLVDTVLSARMFVLRDLEGNRLQLFARCVGNCEQ